MSSSVSCCFTQHIPILNHKCFSRTYKVLLDVQYTTIPQVLATLAAGRHWTLGDRGHNVPSVSWYWCRYGVIILHLLPKYKLSLKDSTLSISLYTLCTCKYWESLNNSNILRPWHNWCSKVFSYFFQLHVALWVEIFTTAWQDSYSDVKLLGTPVFVSISNLKAHISFSLGDPEDVTSMAIMNSVKSIDPFLSASKFRNTFSANMLASFAGKNFSYILINSFGFRTPLEKGMKSNFFCFLVCFTWGSPLATLPTTPGLLGGWI